MSNLKEAQHKWYLKNRERVIENQKAYRKEKMNNDYEFRMSVVNYQSKYYQTRKNKLAEKKNYIKQNEARKGVVINLNDTKIII
jgi:hypothetical protein